MANNARYSAHEPCYKSVNIEWRQNEQYHVKIKFFDETAARAYRAIIRRNHFHKHRRTRANIDGRTVSLALLPDVAKVRTCDKLRGFVFVFSSTALAAQWKKNTLLWREYIGRPGELYIDKHLTQFESDNLMDRIRKLRPRDGKLQTDHGPGERAREEEKSGRMLDDILENTQTHTRDLPQRRRQRYYSTRRRSRNPSPISSRRHPREADVSHRPRGEE